MKQRIILHIDFDSFFASVEQQYRPELRGKPIGVTAANSRTCIIAASYEAKKYGIKTGSNSYSSFEKCPQLQLVAADFVKYFEVSKKFLNIAKDFSPYVELFSIDEVFIDATLTASLFEGIEALILKIKKRIEKELGKYITVSVGVSHNKLLAKMASKLKKPNGVCFVTEKNLEKVYAQADLTDICGIGERIRLRLNQIGVYTLLQLRQTSLNALIEEFGRHEGWFLKNIGWGKDDTEVIPYTQKPEVKSVSRNYCLPQNEYNMQKVFQNVYELCEEVCLKLRRLGKQACTLGIYLRGTQSLRVCTTLLYPFDTSSIFFHEGVRLISNQYAFKSSDYVRQISVWVSNLSDYTTTQLCLFSNTIKSRQLTQAVDALNEKFGDHTIRNGFLLYADKLTTVPNGWMADRFERTKLAMTS